ncbi:protocadherin beta-15 isoform X1 [Octopus bimaculoides]|uniref:protocadherin beta-15 isoform X1 n=1 Tax=Octopus bimaculoides TaxID=37653 RepID=UPI0022E3C6E7|nr:protocadherin beta-15 isoform X1 [Octopus bimaculoides]
MKRPASLVMWLELHLFYSFFFSFFFFPVSLSVDVTYHLEEENSPDSYIGNIATDLWLLSNIASKDHSLISFDMLQSQDSPTAQLFNVTHEGKLYATQTVDAEILCLYNTECYKILKIAVRKEGTFMKILKVKVVIEDINDQWPEFPVKKIDIQFSEDDRNGVERSVPSAIDRDVSIQNSRITYELRKKNNEPFSLSVTKRMTGSSKLAIVLDKKLDREMNDSYILQVVAKNSKFQLRQSILNVQILVTDENDNLPVFSQNIYNTSVNNIHKLCRPLIVLSATDLDSGKNGQLTYLISTETSLVAREYFHLNETSGAIYLGKNFTSKHKKTYKLLVEARDNGDPPLSSTALVYIQVVNIENNPPIIDINFVFQLSRNVGEISEKINIDSFIAYVSVIDNNMGKNGEVKCDLHHAKFQLLDLGPNEYKMTLKQPVDREIRDHYDITISCQDKGTPPLQTLKKFSIKVMDVNDVKPMFNKNTFKFLTYENGKPNFPIGFINATDPDMGAGGQLTFSLLSTSKHVIPFQITDYGFISTTIPLDREQQNVYKFQVFVKDNGNPSLNNTANVIVEVLDENDNAPYFTFPSSDPFSLDVHYHPQSKKEITILRASDRDSHMNSFLRYEILKGNIKQLFAVNPYTGVLSYSRTVYQNDAGSYQLEFAVKDSGTPVLSATTTVSLTLTVSNKTSPALSTVQLKSDKMINLTWVIVIVTSAVIVSVAIVVSITLCVVRCNNNRNNQYITEINSDREKSHYTCVTKKSDTLNRSSNDMMARNTQLIETKAEFYPQYESQSEWTTSTIDKRPQSVLLKPLMIENTSVRCAPALLGPCWLL